MMEEFILMICLYNWYEMSNPPHRAVINYMNVNGIPGLEDLQTLNSNKQPWEANIVTSKAISEFNFSFYIDAGAGANLWF